MEVVVSADDSGTSQVARLTAENADLRQQIATLSQQLAWLQRQVFGQKSERRLLDNPDQLGLETLLGDAAPAASVVATQEIHYTRRAPKARDESCVTDEGLRFGSPAAWRSARAAMSCSSTAARWSSTRPPPPSVR